jgi:hypothetical protein
LITDLTMNINKIKRGKLTDACVSLMTLG